jgi:hypothetical protein
VATTDVVESFDGASVDVDVVDVDIMVGSESLVDPVEHAATRRVDIARIVLMCDLGARAMTKLYDHHHR